MPGSTVFQGLVRGAIDGALAIEKSYPVLFTADSSTGAFTAYTLPAGFGGALIDFSFKFGNGALAPNSLTYAITDENGLTIASGTITASSGRDNLGATVPMFAGSTITLSGNTTVSATVLATLYLV